MTTNVYIWYLDVFKPEFWIDHTQFLQIKFLYHILIWRNPDKHESHYLINVEAYLASMSLVSSCVK